MSTEVSITSVEEVRELIEEGREVGAVPLSRIVDVVDAVNLSEEQQERLLQTLAELGIEVLGEVADPVTNGVAPRLDLTVKAQSSDPVRMYLKEIGTRRSSSPPSRRCRSPSASSAATWPPSAR